MGKTISTVKRTEAFISSTVRGVRVSVRIPPSRRLTVNLPKQLPTGNAELIVLPLPTERGPKAVVGGRDSHPAFGMWADRKEAADPAAFAGELRRRVWERRDRES